MEETNVNTFKGVDFETWYTMSEAAKIINKGIGRTKLFKFLKEKYILMPNREPYQQQIDDGHFKYVVKAIPNYCGEILFYQTVTLVSMKGIDFIKQLLNKKESENEK